MADTLVRAHFVQLLPSFQCEVNKGTLAVVPDLGREDTLNRVLYPSKLPKEQGRKSIRACRFCGQQKCTERRSTELFCSEDVGAAVTREPAGPGRLELARMWWQYRQQQ